MNENVVCGVNAAMFEYFIHQFYESNQGSFAGASAIMGERLTYAATTSPTLALVAGATDNVAVTFSAVQITPPAGQTPFALSVALTGTLTLTDGFLHITAISTTVSGGGTWIDPIVGRLVEVEIQDRYAARVASFPIPAFSNIANSTLFVTPRTVTVTTGLATVTASLTYDGNDVEGTPPSAQLSTGNDASAFVAFNVEALTTALQTQSAQFPKVIPVNSTSSTAGEGYGVQGSISIGYPTLAIQNSTLTATTEITFNLQVGLEVLWSWTWVSLPVPPATAVLDIIPIAPTLNQASLQVSAVQSISYPTIDFPSGFGFVASDILSVIESEVSSHLQSSAVGQQFPLLTYPSSIVGPSTPFQADLTVAETSLCCYFSDANSG